ncbi:MAG: hypothetical protein A2X86_18675 [Bdellovibrionales bacterium GWA2_49_15]|nr:MAG: hypothetical protein A2X86_18675 [Bdellovibrionales bacterium GWA2_49_15]HAZ14252.1 hypothetical protein [Bdellovibrionales bacterium]
MWKCCYRPVVLIFACYALAGPSLTWATPRHLILITHWQQRQRAMSIKQQLIYEMGIPEQAIDVVERYTPCAKVFEALYFLCVVEGEELFRVVTSQPLFFREAFGHLLSSHPNQKKDEK